MQPCLCFCVVTSYILQLCVCLRCSNKAWTCCCGGLRASPTLPVVCMVENPGLKASRRSIKPPALPSLATHWALIPSAAKKKNRLANFRLLRTFRGFPGRPDQPLLVLISFIRTDTGCLAKATRMPTPFCKTIIHTYCGQGFELPSIITFC